MRNNTNRLSIFLSQNKILLWFLGVLLGIFLFGLYEEGPKIAKTAGTSYPIYFLFAILIGAAGSIMGALLFLVIASNHPDLMASKTFHRDDVGTYLWLYNPTNIPIRVEGVVSSIIKGDRSKVTKLRLKNSVISYLDISTNDQRNEDRHIKCVDPGSAIKLYISQNLTEFIQIELTFSYAIDFRNFKGFICIHNPAVFEDHIRPDFMTIERSPDLSVQSR